MYTPAKFEINCYGALDPTHCRAVSAMAFRTVAFPIDDRTTHVNVCVLNVL
jgi:hypothetical protein